MIDWEAIQSEYITGKLSYVKLAEKYDIPYTTVRDRALRYGWVQKRAQWREKAVQETVQKVRKAQVKSDAQKLISLARSADKLGSAIDHALSDTEQLYRYVVSESLGDGVSETTCKTFAKLDTRSARDLAGALKDLTSVVRNLYGLPTIQEQNAMDIAAARLEMDRQRARLDNGDEDETGVVEIAPVLEEEQEDGT